MALGKRGSAVSVSCDLSRSNDWSEAPVGLSDGDTDAISSDRAWSCSKDSRYGTSDRTKRSTARTESARYTYAGSPGGRERANREKDKTP